MAVIRISEAEAARDLSRLLERVRAGVEVLIESSSAPAVALRAAEPPRRTIEECIALLPEGSAAVIDEGFAHDVEAAVASHRESLNPPAWA